MSKVSTKDSSEESKRAPRRQAVRKASSSRTRKAPVMEVVERRMEEDNVPLRKAPTSVSGNKSRVYFSRNTIVFSGAFVAVLAAAIWIGTTDNGQINVATKIEERNNQIAKGEFTADNSSGVSGDQIIPVQNSAPTVPNGGLKGRGVGTPPANQQAAAVTAEDANASSTENASTSTEATNDDNQSAEANEENTETTNNEGEATSGANSEMSPQ